MAREAKFNVGQVVYHKPTETFEAISEVVRWDSINEPFYVLPRLVEEEGSVAEHTLRPLTKREIGAKP